MREALRKFWQSVASIIDTADVLVSSVNDVAQTGKLYTEDLYTTTQLELSAELSANRKKLEAL